MSAFIHNRIGGMEAALSLVLLFLTSAFRFLVRVFVHKCMYSLAIVRHEAGQQGCSAST
jgi:hypothetical protein